MEYIRGLNADGGLVSSKLQLVLYSLHIVSKINQYY